MASAQQLDGALRALEESGFSIQIDYRGGSWFAVVAAPDSRRTELAGATTGELAVRLLRLQQDWTDPH